MLQMILRLFGIRVVTLTEEQAKKKLGTHWRD